MPKELCKRCGREKGSEFCIAWCGTPEKKEDEHLDNNLIPYPTYAQIQQAISANLPLGTVCGGCHCAPCQCGHLNVLPLTDKLGMLVQANAHGAVFPWSYQVRYQDGTSFQGEMLDNDSLSRYVLVAPDAGEKGAVTGKVVLGYRFLPGVKP